MTDKTYKYSEIFHSFQGEGARTGHSTSWIRFFLCNLQCDGFGQKNPLDSSSYVLPYKDVDVTLYDKIEDLPVFEYGCDSSYTWSKKFRHLAHDNTPSEICDELQNCLKHPTNPEGLFHHPQSGQMHHHAFTGGEPMLNQEAMVAILQEFENRGNNPYNITVETNGTKPIKEDLATLIEDSYVDYNWGGIGETEWFWSCSPKLRSTSGELAKKAIKPEVVGGYAALGCPGQLKYVVNGTQQSWDEVEEHTAAFRKAGVPWDVWIMPVGATLEEQEEPIVAEIAVEAIKRGYNVSGRLHCYIFGNKIGT